MKKRKKWLCALFTVLAFIVCSTTIYAAPASSEEAEPLGPYFFVEGADPEVDSFPLKATDVVTNIKGVFAETYITQTYVNDGDTPINANYVFPASTSVTVHGMKMIIGDKTITAKIQEKEEAKQEYEQAKSEGKSASLLEQQRPNVFNMNVANIMPGDIVLIELHYTELITPTENIYQFVFPTVVGPRYVSPAKDTKEDSSNWAAAPYIKNGGTVSSQYNITVNLSTGVTITELTSKSHEVNVNWDNEAEAQVTLTNPEKFAGDRDFILDYRLTGEGVRSGLILGTGDGEAGNDENFFMMMIQPPERFTPEEIPPREYIFVLDVSGSMRGFPLNTAKTLIRNLLNNLQETDSFNLILFDGASIQMSPESLPATNKNTQAAIALINEQKGGGGTRLSAALEDALAIPRVENVARSVVIITDGYISAEKEVFDMIRENVDNTSFFSFGIGSSVNRYLIEGIAKAGTGEAFIVTDENEAISVAERFRTYIKSPLLTDIKISYDGFDAYAIEPENIPVLFAERPIVVYGKWKGEPAGTITVTGKTGSQDYVQKIQVAESVPLAANNSIRYLWAREAVDRLTDLGGDPDEVKAEITALGLKYSMMTAHTSFIAVHDVIRNETGNSTDVDQPLPLPEGVSDLAVGGYTTGSEPGEILLILAVITMIAVSALCSPRRRARTCK